MGRKQVSIWLGEDIHAIYMETLKEYQAIEYTKVDKAPRTNLSVVCERAILDAISDMKGSINTDVQAARRVIAAITPGEEEEYEYHEGRS